MAGINVRLPGSSLLECIVAAVIMLICFEITMEMLTRMTLTGNDPVENVTIELAIRQAFREYGDGEHANGKYNKTEEWGSLEIELSPYGKGIQRLTLVATPTQGIQAVKCDYLIKLKE